MHRAAFLTSVAWVIITDCVAFCPVVSQSALTGLAGWPTGIPIGTPPAAALSRARLSCNLPWISTSRRSTLWWWEAGRGILIRRQLRRAPEAATSSVAAEAAPRGQYAEALGATRPDHGAVSEESSLLGPAAQHKVQEKRRTADERVALLPEEVLFGLARDGKFNRREDAKIAAHVLQPIERVPAAAAAPSHTHMHIYVCDSRAAAAHQK